jgi:3-oxoacyl-[acyl-carrier-protein] synthase III
MKFTFHRKRISGLLTVVPAKERSFLEEMHNFKSPESRSLKLKEVMGFDKRRIVEPDVCVSDLAVFGLQHLFDQGLLKPDEIDALILVTQSPDYFMPPTSNVIQGRLNLKQDLFCLDISQGCAGFVVGLMQSFMLLDQESVRKVVLINADVLSRKVSPQDRNIYPLIGDAAAITLVERDAEDSVIHARMKMDGCRSDVLIIPAGGMRLPSTPETAALEDVGDNNLRAKDHLRMAGSEVFNFVQVEVPQIIHAVLGDAGRTAADVDYFLCHQPNRFMLQKLADKMKVPHERMPNNLVERYGNTSGATIPMVITCNLAGRMQQERLNVCLAGFGVGLTWGAMLLQLDKVLFNTIIDYK